MEQIPQATTDHPLPPQTDEFEYQVLVPHADKSRMATPEALQENYLKRLSDLIEDAVGDPETRVDTIVFLDKSARPLAWMMRTFWDDMAPQETDPDTGRVQTVAMPDMKFANIDRLTWRAHPDKEMREGGAREATEEDIAGLRHIFSRTDEKSLVGKKILVVDEQAESGDTLKIAEELFSKAFPESNVRGKPWIKHPSIDDPVTGEKIYKIEEIPAWYPLKGADMLHEDDRGRGVYSPIPYVRRSEQFRQNFPPASNQFLASRPQVRRSLDANDRARLKELGSREKRSQDPQEMEQIQREMGSIEFSAKDPKSDQLRREIGQMLVDFHAGKLNPSITTDRQEIRGVPAEQYYKEARAAHEQ